MDGVLRCLRYAFGPNRLHLCGPEASPELLGYLMEQKPDKGLTFLLTQFKTMHPYLKKIAEANKIKDPLDEGVVEAYWIGNELLEFVSSKDFYHHLKGGLGVHKKMNSGQFEKISSKLGEGARMHHSFHVFNIWKRTGNVEEAHTLDSMDKCRIGWGEVISVDGPFVGIKTNSLLMDNRGKMVLGPEVEKKIVRRLDNDSALDIGLGDIITFHWDTLCESISRKQLENLKKYTQLSIQLANQYLL